MKLLRLKLNTPFRSLPKEFEVKFLDDWNWDRSFKTSDYQDYLRCFKFNPYCFAGLNGSGKSNVLEALAAIFYHIECIHLEYRPDGFESEEDARTKDDGVSLPKGFASNHSNPDAFELEYLIPNDRIVPRDPWPKQDDWPVFHIRIRKKARQRPEIHWLNKLRSGEVAETELTRAEIKAYLPTYILGYSSGHNETLSLPFFKMRFIHFDEYRDKVAKDDYYGKPEGRMIYLDDQFSQAILLCHFLFPSKAVTKVFEEKVGLKGIRCFRIIIRRHHRIAISSELLQSISVEDQKGKAKTTVELTSKLSGHYDDKNQLQLALIDKLIKCSTAHYEDSSGYPDGESCDLYLDYLINDATRRAFHVHFGEASGGDKDLNKARSALNLFQSLQTLLTLNHYQVDETTKADLYHSRSLYLNETIPMPASHERIMRFKDFELTKKGVNDPLYGKSLSDGEHQLIHTIGLCLLYRHESALFLLDEPETHLNPDWRASYISTLRAALEADESTSKVMREVLLTSHSPFIISDCHKENVLVFTKDTMTQKVTCDRPQFQTFGASATLITNEIFDRPETIGDFANDELKRLESLAGQVDQNPLQLARQLDRALGDSIEKTLAINRILGGSKES